MLRRIQLLVYTRVVLCVMRACIAIVCATCHSLEMSHWYPPCRLSLTVSVNSAIDSSFFQAHCPRVVVLSVRFEDTSQVSLLLSGLELFHHLILLLGHLISLHSPNSNVVVDLLKTVVHGHGIHAVHDGLARQAIKADVVVRPISVLIVKERALGHRYWMADLAHGPHVRAQISVLLHMHHVLRWPRL